MPKRKPLDPYTLRYVAGRMRRYQRHYEAVEQPRATEAAFAHGIARMARKAADECLGTAERIEARALKPRKVK